MQRITVGVLVSSWLMTNFRDRCKGFLVDSRVIIIARVHILLPISVRPVESVEIITSLNCKEGNQASDASVRKSENAFNQNFDDHDASADQDACFWFGLNFLGSNHIYTLMFSVVIFFYLFIMLCFVFFSGRLAMSSICTKHKIKLLRLIIYIML